jgi:TRAP-type C4-dicarboxylate transport system substrate-binding protein
MKVAVIVLSLLLVLGTFGCSSNEQQAVETPKKSETPEKEALMEPVELKFAHFFSAVHPVETKLAAEWKKAIEEATDGLITVITYPGETLLKAADVYEGVATGIADVGFSVFTYNAGRFPVIEGFELPGIVYKSSKVASSVAWEGLKELNPQEIQDTKLIFATATGPSHLITKIPIRSLEDIQGVEIRTFGYPVKAIEAIGAVPVAMTAGEAYEALSRGIVQGNCAPLEVLKGFMQAEVTRYITYTPFLSNAIFFTTMNLDTWNSFPKEIQDTILEVNEKIFVEVAAGLWDEICQEGFEYAVQEYGHEDIELSDEEIDRWLELLIPLHEEYIKDMEEKGFPGREIVETIKRLADKYNELYD